MAGIIQKSLLKLRILIKPKGYSRIKKGVGRGLYWSHQVSDLRYLAGEYEPVLAKWLHQKIAAGHSFLDIGANAGYFSLLAAKLSSSESQRIVAVEPMEANLELIQKHVTWNNLKRIECLPYAVADSDRQVTFTNTSNLAANTYIEESGLHKNAEKISIEAKSLDSICTSLGLENFVVKIDVEGAELDVLKGSVNTLTKTKPEIILATHECHVKGVEQACLNFLETYGYSCEPIADEKHVAGQRDYLCIAK